MQRVIVLGAGGPSGTSWEAGFLAGLAVEGFPLASPDLIIGTAGGAYVGAQLALGFHPTFLQESLAAITAFGRAPELELNELAKLYTEIPFGGPAADAHLAAIGACALASTRVLEASFLAAFQSIDAGAVWPKHFACTAIDVVSGEFKVFDDEAGAPLRAAVAASCASPGHYPPITIKGRRYMDGGVRSATNADMAAGADRVLILSAALPSAADAVQRKMNWEYAAIDASGGTTMTHMPDVECAAVFGLDDDDAFDAQAVGDAAFRQGRAAAGSVLVFWNA